MLWDWLESTSEWMGLELQRVSVPYPEVVPLLEQAGLALVELTVGNGEWLALLLEGHAGVGTLLGPDGELHRMPLAELDGLLTTRNYQKHRAQVDAVIAAAGVPPRRQARTREALLHDALGNQPMSRCWLVRAPAGASPMQQLLRAGVGSGVAMLLLCHALSLALGIGSWWVLGAALLDGRFAAGTVSLWALLLLSTVPFRVASKWASGELALRLGLLLKRRLLAGAVRLDPESMRSEGIGQLMSRVFESSEIETLATSGGIAGALSVIELTFAFVILVQGAAPLGSIVALVATVMVTLGLSWEHFRRHRRWTDLRRSRTHRLIEQLLGHRTRLLQERPGDGAALAEEQARAYLDASMDVDATSALLVGAVPGAWLLVGVAVLVPTLLEGRASEGALAAALGGLLLAHQALRRLTAGLNQLSGAGIAWQGVAALYSAAARRDEDGTLPPRPKALVPAPEKAELLTAENLEFRYPSAPRPALSGCDFVIRQGDQILLEGPSGGGKSTLGSLIAGLRAPSAGRLLLDGLDRHTLGLSGWRRRVVAAPQFHENHIYVGSFAFNLLMGRRWPPEASDFEEAREVCAALGLDGLLSRMPSGLNQPLGETGWQLSHGERGRLFIARALLQHVELVVLDESFAALDPQSLRQTLQGVRERAPTLLVIAHP